MSHVEELKRRARRAEAAGEHRLALERYEAALEEERETADPDRRSPALRLRVGDLRFRLDRPEEALDAYLRASQLYARQGLLPNAVAVCEKLLGVYPEHLETHLRLAELKLEAGFTAEARDHLVRYLEEAPDRGRSGAALDAARAFLEVEPDQVVAVAVAELLAGEGRTDRALRILREVWEERTGLRRPAGRIEAFALELDPEADLGAWTPVWPPPRKGRDERETGGRASGRAAEEGAPGSAAAREEPPGDGGSGDERGEPAEAGAPSRAGPAAPWQARPAVQARAAAPPGPGSARDGGFDGDGDAGFDGDGDAALRGAGDGGGDGGGEEDGPDAASGGRPSGGDVVADAPGSRGNGGRTPEAQAPEAGTPEIRTPEAQAPEDPPPEAGTPEIRTPEAQAPEDPPPEPRRVPIEEPPADGDGGGEAGLRRGLALVEEMLELAPDHLELHRRRVRYARRLGDLGLLERALVELGRALVERGCARGARFVFEEVRERLNPGSAAAAAGLRRLDRREEAPADWLPAEGEAADAGPAGGRGRREGAVDRRFRRRLREALASSPTELAWLHAAAGSCRAEGSGPVSGPSHELLGRYLLMRGRPGEAAEHLEAALERSPDGGERSADLLYHLGRAWRRAGEPRRARSCFERLAETDPDFRAAWEVVTPDGA